MDIFGNLESYLEGRVIFAHVIVFIGGIVTSYTPCVYPVIPIVMGYVGGQKEKSRRKAFLLSLFYVIGLAVTFSALGVFVSLTGKLFGQIQSSPIAHIIVGNVILLFGLSLLGVFTIPVPSFLRRAGVSKKRSFMGAFSMGLASGFVAAPCVSAILGVLLTYVATRQNIIFGFTLLFTFALGMGVLLVLIGTFAGIIASLPKSGIWMERIEKVFGWFMIALGEYFIIKGGTLLI